MADLLPLFDTIQRELSINSSELKEEVIKKVLKETQDIYGTEDFKWFFECSAKEILYEIAGDFSLSQEEKIEKFYSILDISIIGQQNGMLDDILPFVLIEDLMDMQTVAECSKLFDFLNSRISSLIENGINGTKGKGLVLLRLCNELLRRLSKTKDSLFSGNVSMFLSHIFPLRERSGLNLRGDFHVENITVWEDMNHNFHENQKQQGEIKKEDKISDKEKKRDISDNEKKEKIPLNTFYTIFWSMQKFFSDPSLLYNSKEMQEFKLNASIVLDKIKSLEDEQRKANEVKIENRKGDRKKKPESLKYQQSHDYFEMHFFPKFLTSFKLFKLQLTDSKFRKHILIQFIILFDYLLTLKDSEKNKQEKVITTNRLLQTTYLLSQEDEIWVTETLSKVYTILESTLPDGQRFSQNIRSILSFEKNWVNWKLQGCNAFEEFPISETYINDIKAKYEKESETLKAYKYPLGNLALSRLWERGGTHTMEDMAKQERFMFPDIKTLLEPAQHDPDIENIPINERNSIISERNTIKSWKALRILSHSKLHLFNKLSDRTIDAISQIDQFFNDNSDKNTTISTNSPKNTKDSPQKQQLNTNNKRTIDDDTKDVLHSEKRTKILQ
ncbi:hypothetical protein T552_00521 [Pneumocystis carinii B80]|uniref:THO complex subunit 1 n=1 Tax=Pneumocystis carinii (strain B80) TaxID=1408658 RepID=A0A0W4ZR01_PNEC8|nr:hypothetical protein T552_00521 [Pneumocystis carinii B80]KTW30809.1 hypothetical protein T552_00521 [Pneumocystis carinii B80]